MAHLVGGPCWFRALVLAGVASGMLPPTLIAQPTLPRTPWTTSRLAGTPEPPAPYRIQPSFPKLRFQKPTSVEELPGSGQLLVSEMGGKVYAFPKQRDVQRAEVVLDLATTLPTALRGQPVSLFDVEVHPQFPDQPYLFLTYVYPGPERHTRLSRWTLQPGETWKADADSERVILTWPAGGHNGGCLEFGPDRLLYISTGDGSGPNPPDGLTTGQDLTDLLGAILRIDINQSSDTEAYRIPPDNPFVSHAGARPEIWAYGLRNPFKFGIDARSQELFVADNGWESWEMVYRVQRGTNCGWPVMEGRAALRTEVPVGPTPITPPLKDHPHTEANSVIGGPVYSGEKLPDLAGSFVYGDYITGTIWSVRPDPDRGVEHRTLVDTDLRIVAFTTGSHGELYVLDYDLTGQLYELIPSNQPDRSASFPRRLSETGLFASTPELKPAPGVVPYTVRAARWMDGASAQRWIAIPGDGRVALSTDLDQPSLFPDGTVLVKHLSLPPASGGSSIPLETQLLHLEQGVWHPYSYLWDEDGQDAQLVGPLGTRHPTRIPPPDGAGETAERTWHVNAANECKLCHEGAAHVVLGFSLNQLAHSGETGGFPNQLERLAAEGVLQDAPPFPDDHPARLVDPHDSSQPLEDRARSYLHANCSMCHHPRGNAIVSFYLRRDLPFERLNTDKGTGIGTFGMTNARIIAPGDPYRSVLFYRMSKLGYARMPYIGSHVVDSAGVSLIEEWIRSLPAAREVSAPAQPRSREAAALQSLATAPPKEGDAPGAMLDELTRSTEASLALVTVLHRGRVPPAVARQIAAHGSQVPNHDVRGLFETFLPESQRRKTLGSSIVPEQILPLAGDPARGQLIFFSDQARCRNCHHRDDARQSVGPTLREIQKQYSRPAEFLQHVLQPSLKIDERYQAHLVATTEGRLWTGLLIEETPEAIVLKTAEQQQVRIRRSDIETMRKSTTSLMPERTLSDLTPQEAADLLAYLRSP